MAEPTLPAEDGSFANQLWWRAHPPDPTTGRIFPAASPPPIDATPVPNPAPDPGNVDIPRPTPATGDERWEMSIGVPKSVADVYQAGPEGYLARQAHTALGALIPGFERRMAGVQAKSDELAQQYREQAEAFRSQLGEREQLVESVKTRMRDFREGLEAARPKAPTLQGIPTPPDLKVRPWLDPEGKNALSVIAQTLGMLATGISGMVVGAPKTALSQFKEAADLWRRDELDAANSKWNEFQATVEQIRNNNHTALEIFDSQSREYGANQLAARAGVLSALDELGLHDQKMVVANQTFELAHRAVQEQLTAAETMLREGTRFDAIVARQKGAAAMGSGLPTSVDKARGESVALRWYAKTEPDPEAKAQMLDRAGMLDQWVKDTQHDKLDYARTLTGVQNAGRGLAQIEKQLPALDQFATNWNLLHDAIETAHRKGMLPDSHGPLETWSARARQAFTDDPEAQGALRTIEQLLPEQIGSYDRNVSGVIGTSRVAAQFNFPKEPTILTYGEFMGKDGRGGVMGYMATGAREAKSRLEIRRESYKAIQGLSPAGPVGEDDASE
jgi:hypothetical protein